MASLPSQEYHSVPPVKTNSVLRLISGAKRAAGICFRCEDPVVPGQTACDKHRREEIRRRLMTKYGLTEDELYAMYNAQNKSCSCCGLPGELSYCVPAHLGFDESRLVIDHDHALGFGNKEAVRGLACSRCNRSVLSAADNSPHLTPLEMALRVVEYLRAFERKRALLDRKPGDSHYSSLNYAEMI